MTRKKVEYEARRQYVIDAARRVFAEKGVEDAGMEDIARAAGYTRRTMYAYFKSRDEICLLVLIEDLAVRWAAQQQAMAGVVTGLDKIRVWAEAFYAFVRENPQSMRLQFFWDLHGIERHRINDEVFAAFERQNNELADGLRGIFRLGISDGSLRPDLHVDMCISQYLYTLRGVLNRAISTTYSFASFDPDEYVRHYLDLFCRGIRNTGGTGT